MTDRYSFIKPHGGGQRHAEVPKFPIIPVLLHFGFDEYELKDYEHGWFKCKCAFHGETNPSASYNTELQAFSCHACDAKGDALKLLQNYGGLDFTEALRQAEEITGVHAKNSGEIKEKTYKVKRVSGSQVAKDLLRGKPSTPVARRRKWGF